MRLPQRCRRDWLRLLFTRPDHFSGLTRLTSCKRRQIDRIGALSVLKCVPTAIAFAFLFGPLIEQGIAKANPAADKENNKPDQLETQKERAVHGHVRYVTQVTLQTQEGFRAPTLALVTEKKRSNTSFFSENVT